MTLPDLLPIQPFTRPARGSVSLPGSKSITNRALLLAALCDDSVKLTNALFSEDSELMIGALRALRFSITQDGGHVVNVRGCGGIIPAEKAELFVGNAGTVARFLTAFCAATPRGTYRIDGVPQMRKRPMAGLINALRFVGAKITCLEQEGFLPLVIEASGLHGGTVVIDASESSQMLSALLMVAPLAHAQLEIRTTGRTRRPFVEMTERMMKQFGYPGIYKSPGTYDIEPDASAASYFLALPLATSGKVSLPHLHLGKLSLQGDTRFAEIVRTAGGTVTETPSAVEASCDKSASRRGVGADFEEFSDTFLTLAAVAPLLSGPTKITGIAHTRKQETDRVAGMARELRKLGQEVEEDEGSLRITPRPLRQDVEIETYNDHRIAMSFAILGSHDLRRDGRSWLRIRNPACCAKTFPEFFDVLEALRRTSLT